MYEKMGEACYSGNYREVFILLKLGASPDGSSDYGEATKNDIYEGEFTSHVMSAVGNPHILKLLIESGADPDISEGDGFTPLGAAVHDHQNESIRILLAAGATPNYRKYRKDNPWTAIDQARKLGYLDLIPIIAPYIKP